MQRLRPPCASGAALDRLQGWKVDFVKITDDKLTPELFLSALGKARARGFTTSAHVPMAVPVAQASAAGLDSIEHIAYAYKAGAPNEAALSVQYEAVTPTLNGSRVTAYLDQDDHAHDDYLEYIGRGLQATYAWRVDRAKQDDAAAIARRHERFERQASILPLLQAAGVRILAGTDAGFLNSFNYPGIGLHDELALYVRYGLTPLQAMQAATINGAEFLGHADTHGTLVVGKAGDVVLLSADPLQDIAATRQVDTVILRGEVHDRGELDAMLEAVAKTVAEAGAR